MYIFIQINKKYYNIYQTCININNYFVFHGKLFELIKIYIIKKPIPTNLNWSK